MTAIKRKKAPQDETGASFREFLSAYRIPILIILLVAFGWRLVLVICFPHGAFDEIRYTAPAVNMLAGRGFSARVTEPYFPGEHTLPLYHIFIAPITPFFRAATA